MLLGILWSCKNSSDAKNNHSDQNIQQKIENKISSIEYKTTDTCFKGFMEINEQPALCILDSAKPQDAPLLMQKNYEKILEDAQYTSSKLADQPGCIFYHTSPQKIVFETFMFLKSKPQKQPKISKPVILEKTLAVLYDHYGSFNTIHQSYSNIQKIMRDAGYKQSGPAREIYVLANDTSHWRTRIIVPVVKQK